MIFRETFIARRIVALFRLNNKMKCRKFKEDYGMTKKELMQLYYLNREIMNDTEELVKMKIDLRNVDGNEWSVESERQIKIHEKKIIEKIRQCTELRDKINVFLENIEDSLTRQVFYYRYSKCMTWQQVSYALGGINTGDGLRKVAERYLKSIEN